jgi:hypothetical protein
MPRKEDEPQPQVEESPAVCGIKPAATVDPYAGCGGTYELNLLTGERKPAPQTEKV